MAMLLIHIDFVVTRRSVMVMGKTDHKQSTFIMGGFFASFVVLAFFRLDLLIGKQGDQAGHKGKRDKRHTGNGEGDLFLVGHFVRVPESKQEEEEVERKHGRAPPMTSNIKEKKKIQ